MNTPVVPVWANKKDNASGRLNLKCLGLTITLLFCGASSALPELETYSPEIQRVLIGKPVHPERINASKPTAKARSEMADSGDTLHLAYSRLVGSLRASGREVRKQISANIMDVIAQEMLLQSRFANELETVSSLATNHVGIEKITLLQSENQHRLDVLFALNDRIKNADKNPNWKIDVAQAVEELRVSGAKTSVADTQRFYTDNNPPLEVMRNASGPIRTGNVAPVYASSDNTTPTEADYQSGLAAQISPAVAAKAAELEYDYVAIFDFVRTQVKTQYYSGAAKGADATLKTLSGNSIDQSALLIALLRASGVPARFVHGVIRVFPEQIAASLGSNHGGSLWNRLAYAGVRAEPVNVDGTVMIDMEHTWVAAEVAYDNYRGNTIDFSGKAWIPLAPAFKSHHFKEQHYFLEDMDQFLRFAVPEYLNASRDDLPLEAARTEVARILSDNNSPQSYASLLPKISVDAQPLGVLPNSLPFIPIHVVREQAVLSDEYLQKISVQAWDAEKTEQILSAEIPAAALAQKRVTLSYLPATVADAELARMYGGLGNTPPYLVQVLPQIKVDSLTVATGIIPVSMGEQILVRVSSDLQAQDQGESHDHHSYHIAGSYAALALDIFGALGQVTDAALPLALDREPEAARILHNLGARYMQQWREQELELAGLLGITPLTRTPAITWLKTEHNLTLQHGLVVDMAFKGVSMDVALRNMDSTQLLGEGNTWLQTSALQGSRLESQLFSDYWSVPAISADVGLRAAIESGIEVVYLDHNTGFDQIQSSGHTEAMRDYFYFEMLDGIGGLDLMLPLMPLEVDSWKGAVWWRDGSQFQGYYIAGGYAGGSTTQAPGGLGSTGPGRTIGQCLWSATEHGSQRCLQHPENSLQ